MPSARDPKTDNNYSAYWLLLNHFWTTVDAPLNHYWTTIRYSPIFPWNSLVFHEFLWCSLKMLILLCVFEVLGPKVVIWLEVLTESGNFTRCFCRSCYRMHVFYNTKRHPGGTSAAFSCSNAGILLGFCWDRRTHVSSVVQYYASFLNFTNPCQSVVQ